jgi:aconitate hydratase
MGMLAIGAGGIDVALAMAGRPYYLKMPNIWGVELAGDLSDWVSAKDVILEMLRRHSVRGGLGKIIEYYGPGLQYLSVMDRHVIANMGAELGASATVFPSDGAVLDYMRLQNRESEWQRLEADEGADYDEHDQIDLSQVEPLIAMPSSPDNVQPVRDVAGEPIYQVYVGSSANPGYRDFAIAAEIVRGQRIPAHLSFDINPTSRRILNALADSGRLQDLIRAGARIHQAGCNGCIGMGQAPATDKLSLRTVPRNFPGRSGTPEDRVCLVSPETAAASGLAGKIADPRDLSMPYPSIEVPETPTLDDGLMDPPLPPDERLYVELVKGPNIASLPDFAPLPHDLEVPILLKVGDNISTDEILPAGAAVLPFRSNIPKIAEFAFRSIDATYYDRAVQARSKGGHAVVAGLNYGQGSSREHAAMAPRYLGLCLAIAKSFARIHLQNLVNFGVLPLRFANSSPFDCCNAGDVLRVNGWFNQLRRGPQVHAMNVTQGVTLKLEHSLAERDVSVLSRGGAINWIQACDARGASHNAP